MDFQGGQCKKMENSRGVSVNLTGNPGGGVNFKKKIYIYNRGVQLFSGKAQYDNHSDSYPLVLSYKAGHSADNAESLTYNSS